MCPATVYNSIVMSDQDFSGNVSLFVGSCITAVCRGGAAGLLRTGVQIRNISVESSETTRAPLEVQ